MINQELFNFRSSEFEFGLERELLLVAHNSEGQKFNLALSPFVIERVKQNSALNEELMNLIEGSWSIIPEYSLTLIEVVSSPVVLNLLEKVCDEFEIIRLHIEEILNQEIKESFPELESYTFSIETAGSSNTNNYLLANGEVVTDEGSQEHLVLETEFDFTEELKNHTLVIDNHIERGVGIYNHINSTHFTFHPRYGENPSLNFFKYLMFISCIGSLIEVFRKFDRGNKEVQRNGETIIFEENVRDTFLESMLQFKFNDRIPNSYQSASNPRMENKNLEAITQLLASEFNIDASEPKNLDQLYRKWSSTNYRPRFTEDNLALIEVRSFGSSISLEDIKMFIYLLNDLDNYFEIFFEKGLSNDN